ncbi:MAG: DUF5059 domain-containing protein [Haloarculaceae archaeon]
MPNRRDLIKTVGVAATGVLAGCPGSSDSSSGGTATDEPQGDGADATPSEDTPTDSPESSGSVGPKTAVAAELNVYRARLYDAVALARAGAPGAGASVAENIFGRFEHATGEYGAHEVLEATSQSAYEGFEGALRTLRTELSEGEIEAAADAADEAASSLQVAQQALVGNQGARALDLLWLGPRGVDAGTLASVGAFGAAGTVATEAYETFEDALVHGALEEADSEAYEAFESGLESAASAAGSKDAAATKKQARSALDAAVTGAYAIAPAEEIAHAGHLAAMQARGFDAAAVASMGGPGTDYAHAAALNVYRARVYDAGWLADRGASDTAATVASDIFAHFEGAKAHDALEHADSEAYEGFESGLDSLSTAIESGDAGAVDGAVTTVDSNLVAGIEALAGANAPVVQSGFFRARFADARELYELGANGAAATVVSDLFARFEENELAFHETLEHTSEDLYHRFEEEHLTSLQTAYENGDDAAVETHHAGVQQALLDFEAEHSAAVASGAETAYMAGSVFDAAAVATLGNGSRAAAIVSGAFQTFEGGAAGYHEALEEADHETYEAFEAALSDVRSAAESGGDVYGAAKKFNAEAIAGIYAIVASSGGGNAETAAGIVGDVFATFENARVHEALEEADHDAYEGFESAMNDYASALQSGNGDPTAFAAAARTAQFAVVGAVDAAPEASGGESSDGESGGETNLEGGPNVVEGVPEDADHVVEAKAVSFAPKELEVSVGDTVAFKHAGGEAHSVTAYGDNIPDGATYWASGGFDSEEAARSGWEAGKGAVQSGQSYVHTFETAGEHQYVCIPHEAAGMKGTIVVTEQGNLVRNRQYFILGWPKTGCTDGPLPSCGPPAGAPRLMSESVPSALGGRSRRWL